jgi:hypothetical protein
MYNRPYNVTRWYGKTRFSLAFCSSAFSPCLNVENVSCTGRETDSDDADFVGSVLTSGWILSMPLSL